MRRPLSWPGDAAGLDLWFARLTFYFGAFAFIIICNHIAANQPFAEVKVFAPCRAKGAVLGFGGLFADGASHVRTSCTTGRSRLRFSSPWPNGVQPTNSVATGQLRKRRAGPLRSVCDLVCSLAQNQLQFVLNTPQAQLARQIFHCGQVDLKRRCR